MAIAMGSIDRGWATPETALANIYAKGQAESEERRAAIMAGASERNSMRQLDSDQRIAGIQQSIAADANAAGLRAKAMDTELVQLMNTARQSHEKEMFGLQTKSLTDFYGMDEKARKEFNDQQMKFKDKDYKATMFMNVMTARAMLANAKLQANTPEKMMKIILAMRQSEQVSKANRGVMDFSRSAYDSYAAEHPEMAESLQVASNVASESNQKAGNNSYITHIDTMLRQTNPQLSINTLKNPKQLETLIAGGQVGQADLLAAASLLHTANQKAMGMGAEGAKSYAVTGDLLRAIEGIKGLRGSSNPTANTVGTSVNGIMQGTDPSLILGDLFTKFGKPDGSAADIDAMEQQLQQIMSQLAPSLADTEFGPAINHIQNVR